MQLTSSIFSVGIFLVRKINNTESGEHPRNLRNENLSGVCFTNNKKLSKSVFYTNDINPERAESEFREKADAFFDRS